MPTLKLPESHVESKEGSLTQREVMGVVSHHNMDVQSFLFWLVVVQADGREVGIYCFDTLGP